MRRAPSDDSTRGTTEVRMVLRTSSGWKLLRRRVVEIAVAVAFAVFASACSSLRTDFVKQPSAALPPANDTPSARYVQGEVKQHSDLSGFRLLTRSNNALMSRIALIDQAAHSIDLQYYIFDNDDTGRLVAQRLLAAADRGVRVRLLLDDISLDDKDHVFDALDAHTNIEVRLFNPFNTRNPSLPSKIAQFIVDGQRLNRRMHNKSFIVDNVVAIVGGRNIGDAYFDASVETNFRDLDVICIGKVVGEASQAFDSYWNSDAAYPVMAFKDRHGTDADLDRLRGQLKEHARAFAQSDYAQAALEELPNGPTADRRGAWFWGVGELVADQPEKIETRHDEPQFRIGPKIKTILDAAQSQVLLTSPYFVPGKTGTAYLVGLAQRGVEVEALTNSLASTDEPIAYSGYSHYRRDLLEGGVKLFELRPAVGGKQPPTAFGASSGGVALHAKSIVVDSRWVFVGSMNMDQRSKLLNTEMGVIVDCPPLAQAVAEFFSKAIAPTSAFHVKLTDPADGSGKPGKLEWISQENGAPLILDDEPEASGGRKFEVDLLKLLPIESLL
jgi:putative cardiolipin synthase